MVPRNGGAAFGHLLLAFCFGSFFAGYSKADTELIYSGRYSPNLLAAALAVVAGCVVHYCNLADIAWPKGLDTHQQPTYSYYTGDCNIPAAIRLVFHDPPLAIYSFHSRTR